ncbi:hypothetical protein CASFOL_018204 [Castilleja foliolosa]|uniref:non-specific serine/threonine protein kinase n=1 Tax=Castilleja foliolosa TaxID=1961234 RepID=A0ABD3D859_9LAMI
MIINPFITLTLITILIIPPPLTTSLSFDVTRFSPDVTVVLLEGDAVDSVGELELNMVNYLCRVGQVIYNGQVPLYDPTSGKLADFSTHFTFTLDTQNRSSYGNGLAFFLAPVGFQIPPNSAGGFLGLFNTTTTDSSQTQIVSVEFDSFSNPEWDPPYEHVGINKNSIASSITAPWNVTLHSGTAADAYVTYNSTTKNLTVFWSYSGSPNSTLSYQIDLEQTLPEWVTVGITAATGINVERHTLQSWEFSSTLEIAEKKGNIGNKIGLIVGLSTSGFVLVVGFILTFFVLRKRKEDEKIRDENHRADNFTAMIMNDDLERGSGPRRFSYYELASATNSFSNERKLGEGGFGEVYKGHLIDLDLPIAVKKFSRGSKQGKKQYITEVKIISMLRHRNLVQLIGWCHDQGEFLLVYEYMPNGSLDYHLFDKKKILGWNLRYRIVVGLASALLYLHEEWDQCVVHRDIKSSNIMLDSSFNVKLGDFGLARLMDHGLGHQTTGLAGTLGYLAPEYVSTGRASKESDVYSFGIVVLEIATGRKSVYSLDKESQKGLVEWVWDYYGNGELISAVDEKLKTEFDAKQVECLMIVGLWCAHPDRSLRPSIRQATRALNFEADFPRLPTKMPVPVYYDPPSHSISSAEPSITVTSIESGR